VSSSGNVHQLYALDLISLGRHSLHKEIRSNSDNGLYVYLVIVLLFYRIDNGQRTIDPGVHNVQYKTAYFTRSLLDLAHTILHTTTLTIETYFYVSNSKHSYK
jgi:hypothetical protein